MKVLQNNKYCIDSQQLTYKQNYGTNTQKFQVLMKLGLALFLNYSQFIYLFVNYPEYSYAYYCYKKYDILSTVHVRYNELFLEGTESRKRG